MSPSPGDSPARALPAPSGPLIGRTAELTALADLLPDPSTRLVTLTGPPGVGKTRLALDVAAAAAEHFPDGVAFADLTAVRDPDHVAQELAAGCAQTAPGVPAGTLAGVLAGRRLLLVVDNFEHVLPAAGALGDLLAACPGVTALVTSRERLHLRAEREFPLSPLGLPGPVELADPELLSRTPAVALLVEEIRAFDPTFAVTTVNGEAVAEICVRLDGLPLALELAAPRLRLFSPAELLFRLRDRIGSLTADARDVPDRHRTLSAALAWSHDMLAPHERTMFRQLSVFVGGWTLEAAGQVCTIDDVEATTASLVDKSLVRRTGGTGPAARFGMLESLREYAAERLELAGESAAARARHAEHFARLAADIQSRVGTGDERAAIEEVGGEVGNLREALNWLHATGRPAQTLPVATALGWYTYTRGRLGEGQSVLEAALAGAHGEDTPADARAEALIMLGAIALARGAVDVAEDALERGLVLNEEGGSLRLQAIGTAFLGHVARARERSVEAVARHEEAGRLHERAGNVPGVAWSHYDLGLLARRRRDSQRAADLLRQSLRTFRELGYDWAVGCSAWALATVEVSSGRVREAAGLLAEALDAFLTVGDDRGVAQCLEAAASVAAARGDAPWAARLLGAAGAHRDRLAAPLPAEERAAVGAVRLRVLHELGTGPADEAERAGRTLSRAAVLDLARAVLSGRPSVRALREGALTPREADVADLVRQGCTNRQIGRRLGISEKTTEVHVHHIMRKLGASSRAEIAAWVAARDGTKAPQPAP